VICFLYMRKHITRLLIAVALFGAALVGLDAEPAGAHNFDDYSLWVCAYTRDNAEDSIDHSWPVYVVPDRVGYRCMAHGTYSGYRTCWSAVWVVSTGQIQRTSSYFHLCPWSPHEMN